MDLLIVSENLKKAKCPEDIFGGPNDGSEVPKVYRQLIAVVHPDHFLDDASKLLLANQTLTSITDLRDAAIRKVKVGTYGKRDVPAPPVKDKFQAFVVEAHGRKFVLNDLIASGDFCDVYRCVVIAPNVPEFDAVFKIVKSGTDNDLLETESTTLAKLLPPDAEKSGKSFYKFIPKLIDSFLIRGPAYQRRVNILSWYPHLRTLSEVMQVYPDGIDVKDMVWMFKRILHGTGHAHANNIVHGAIIPPHLMIDLNDHGMKILDWSYSVDITPEDKRPKKKGMAFYSLLTEDDNNRVKAISLPHSVYYPPEVLAKKTPTPATDIYMAAKCAVGLVGGDLVSNKMPDTVHREVQDFFLKCLHKDPSKRPQNAWDTHEEFDKLLVRVVGKRKFRPFPMPAR